MFVLHRGWEKCTRMRGTVVVLGYHLILVCFVGVFASGRTFPLVRPLSISISLSLSPLSFFLSLSLLMGGNFVVVSVFLGKW